MNSYHVTLKAATPEPTTSAEQWDTSTADLHHTMCFLYSCVHLCIILLQSVWIAEELCPHSSSVHLPQRVDPLEMLLVITHLTDGDFMAIG